MRCDAATVEVTFRGETTVAEVQPLPVHGNPGLSVYAALLPIGGATTYGTDDISALTPRNGGVRPVCPLYS